MLRNVHTRILVGDFPAAFRFYRDVLGLTPTFGAEEDVYADFQVGEDSIALFGSGLMGEALGDRRATGPCADRVVLVFAVDNVDQASAELRTRGALMVAPPTDHADWGIRTAHFRDPDGNLIEINQPLAHQSA